MLLKIYATAYRGVVRAFGPSLIVDADRVAALPPHAAGKSWRYLATISDGDAIVGSRRDIIVAALTSRGFFASRWAMGVGSTPPHAPLPPRRRAHYSGLHGVSSNQRRAEQAFRPPA